VELYRAIKDSEDDGAAFLQSKIAEITSVGKNLLARHLDADENILYNDKNLKFTVGAILLKKNQIASLVTWSPF
jgi:hypothetical protein